MAAALPIKKIRQRGRTRWQLDMRSVGQGRKMFLTEAEAKNWREPMLAEIANHGTAGLLLSHEQRLTFLEAERKLSAVGATITEVVTYFLEHRKARVIKPLQEAIEEMITAKRAAGRAARYTNQLGYTLDRFALSVGQDAPCCSIPCSAVEKWLNDSGWEQRTKKGYLIDLRTFVRFCIKRGYMQTDPTSAIEAIHVPRKVPGILTVEQCRKLLESTKEHQPLLLPYVTLALFCGIRQAELFRISWADVDLKRKFVRIDSENAKGGKKRRLVEIAPNALRWLKLGGDLKPSSWQERLEDARAKAEVPWPHDCLRHSFCSYHLAQHQSADKTALQAGHSPQILFEHYRELVTAKDAKKFWELRPEKAKPRENPNKTT